MEANKGTQRAINANNEDVCRGICSDRDHQVLVVGQFASQ